MKNFKQFFAMSFFAIVLLAGQAVAQAPSWAVGNYVGRNNRTGEDMTMTIQRNGSVSISVDGRYLPASYNNDIITVNNSVLWRVTRDGDGLRLTRTDNGERINFRKTGDDSGKRPPDWAVGTFYANDTRGGRQITLTITNRGGVQMNRNGYVSNGAFYDETINIDGVVWRLNRSGDGLTARSVGGGRGEIIQFSRGGYDDGPGGGNVPSWAVGTFYGQNPQYGGTITLTVERNGRVRSEYNGATSYGSINGSEIYMEGVTARVTQINNGIRARGDNGNTVNYYRNNSGGGDGPGWGGGNGNAPSWAVGTYRATDPQSGARITLVVNRNGSVTSSANGATSYGTMNGSQIYMEGVTVNVSQTRNGIRTTRVDTGQVVNYRKN